MKTILKINLKGNLVPKLLSHSNSKQKREWSMNRQSMKLLPRNMYLVC